MIKMAKLQSLLQILSCSNLISHGVNSISLTRAWISILMLKRF